MASDQGFHDHAMELPAPLGDVSSRDRLARSPQEVE